MKDGRFETRVDKGFEEWWSDDKDIPEILGRASQTVSSVTNMAERCSRLSKFWAKEAWSACAFSKMKELQEKDAEIERLRSINSKQAINIDKQYQQGCSTQADLNKANEMLFHLNNIETKYQEAMKDIEYLTFKIKGHLTLDSLEELNDKIRTKYGLDKKEG